MITMPPTPGTSNLAQQWETLQSYKEAFMSKEILAAIVSFLADPLSQNARYSGWRSFLRVFHAPRAANTSLVSGFCFLHIRWISCSESDNACLEVNKRNESSEKERHYSMRNDGYLWIACVFIYFNVLYDVIKCYTVLWYAAGWCRVLWVANEGIPRHLGPLI